MNINMGLNQYHVQLGGRIQRTRIITVDDHKDGVKPLLDLLYSLTPPIQEGWQRNSITRITDLFGVSGRVEIREEITV